MPFGRFLFLTFFIISVELLSRQFHQSSVTLLTAFAFSRIPFKLTLTLRQEAVQVNISLWQVARYHKYYQNSAFDHMHQFSLNGAGISPFPWFRVPHIPVC